MIKADKDKLGDKRYIAIAVKDKGKAVVAQETQTLLLLAPFLNTWVPSILGSFIEWWGP
jgi:hypothetical protein